jgi:hypothetical protein
VRAVRLATSVTEPLRAEKAAYPPVMGLPVDDAALAERALKLEAEPLGERTAAYTASTSPAAKGRSTRRSVSMVTGSIAAVLLPLSEIASGFLAHWRPDKPRSALVTSCPSS